jgi:hypothetical protein
MDETCFICCETLNKSKNKKINCINVECNFVMCKECCKTYLLGITGENHCMNCKIQWNDDFIIDNLTRTFWNKDLKEYQKKVLFDIEKARLQENIVEAKCAIEAENIKLRNKEIIKLMKQLKIEKDLNNTKLYRLEKHPENFTLNDNGELVNINNNDETNNKKTQFIMKCTFNECNGFLSSKYKCSLCSNYTCSKCFEQIGVYENFEGHECKPENIESAKLIMKETRNCPNCGVCIFKIDGCDQMWCVQCHTTFSWKTGHIETGKVHNPHYFEYLRRNGKDIPRDPQDIICGGIVDIYEFNQLFTNIRKKFKLRKNEQYIVKEGIIFNNIRIILEFVQYILINFRQKVSDDFNKKNRINFLIKSINEKQFFQNSYKKMMENKRNNMILQILETLNYVYIDFTKELYEILNHHYSQNEIDLNNLFNDCNIFTNKLNDYIDYSQNEINKIKQIYKIVGVNLKKLYLIPSNLPNII